MVSMVAYSVATSDLIQLSELVLCLAVECEQVASTAVSVGKDMIVCKLVCIHLSVISPMINPLYGSTAVHAGTCW